MKRIAALLLAALLAGCAYTYPVVDAGDGIYYAESPPDYTWVDVGWGYYDPFMYPWWYTSYYYPYYPWHHDRHRHPYPAQVPYRQPSVVRSERPVPSIPLVYRDHPTMMREDLRRYYGAQGATGKAQRLSHGQMKPRGFGAPAKPGYRAANSPRTRASSVALPARSMRAPAPRVPRSAGHRPAVRSSPPPRSRHDN